MYIVKYYSRRFQKHEYRRYVNYADYQVRRMADNYAKRHNLIVISMTKEY